MYRASPPYLATSPVATALRPSPAPMTAGTAVAAARRLRIGSFLMLSRVLSGETMAVILLPARTAHGRRRPVIRMHLVRGPC